MASKLLLLVFGQGCCHSAAPLVSLVLAELMTFNRPLPKLHAPFSLKRVKIYIHTEIHSVYSLNLSSSLLFSVVHFKLAGSAVFYPPTVLWIKKKFCKVKIQYLKAMVKITSR